MKPILTGDIGGTKCRIALVEVMGTRVKIIREVTYKSRDYPLFETLVSDFLEDAVTPVHAAFGVAGPVQGRTVRTTNLPWFLDSDSLQQRHGLLSCTLLNDLEATAYGLSALEDSDLLTLQIGTPSMHGNSAVIAAGTGLGEAGLYWDGTQHHPFASEGGHGSFSPSNELELALLRYLWLQFPHVSWERVLSGMGLVNVYQFLCDFRKTAVSEEISYAIHHGDPAAAIAQAALKQSDAICVETMQCFIRLYGSEAGNLALKVMSRQGIYLGGGIAPKLLPLLQKGDFMTAFLNKGRMRPLLESMPVKVVLNDRAALFGPALFAARMV